MEIDAGTVSRAQRGDTHAQAAFLRAVGPSVRALLRRLHFGNETEDEVQEVYAKLLDVLPRFRLDGPARPQTWVYAVVHRWVLERQRKRRLYLVPLDKSLDVADPAPGPDERASTRQRQRLFEEALSRLSEEHRRVIVFTQLHQQPLDEFAEVEGIPLGTVKSRLHRARAELAAALGPALDPPQEGGLRAFTR
jgi:RNA polymerase sigma-70 factor (ECF subfamily)